VKRQPLPSKRLTCRYCGRAFALPAAAFRHRDVCKGPGVKPPVIITALLGAPRWG
jgi:hypothetical protein